MRRSGEMESTGGRRDEDGGDGEMTMAKVMVMVMVMVMAMAMAIAMAMAVAMAMAMAMAVMVWYIIHAAVPALRSPLSISTALEVSCFCVMISMRTQ